MFRIGGSGTLENVQTVRGGGAGDSTVTLTPNNTTGSVTVTASAATFAATDVGRLLAIKDEAGGRVASTAYAAGIVMYADDRGVKRLYRVISAGTTAAASMAGTTPNYDLNMPTGESLELRDGTCVLRYLGRGKAAWGWGTITAYTSSTQVTVAVASDGNFANVTAALHWKLGEFSPARGYPRCGCFYQNRLILAGSTAKPQSVWASEVGDYEKFSPCDPDGVVLDTNGITQTVDDDQLSEILFASPGGRGVALGTTSGAFLFGPSSNTNRVLTPSNCEARRQGDEAASEDAAGLRIGSATIYLDASGRSLRDLSYDFATDGYQNADLTLLSQHIAGDGFVEVAYQMNPDGVIWAVREDGALASLTYDKDQQVRAWARHILGGVDDVGEVESVAVVPSADGKTDEVYIAVRRDIAGVEHRWIEVIGAPFRGDLENQADAFHVDAGLTYSGTAVTSVTGLSHLEGALVRVVADGAVRTSRTVTAGAIYIDTPAAEVVHVGLPFTSRVKLLPIVDGAAQGSGLGRKIHIPEVRMRLLYSATMRVGYGSTLETVDFRMPGDLMDTAVPLFSGIKQWTPPADWDWDTAFTIESFHGLPMTVLAVALEVSVSG
jgi:hypothetical protein